MSKLVLDDVVMTVDGSDFSDHVAEVAIEVDTREADVTSLGAKYREFEVIATDPRITATLYEDQAPGSVSDVLWGLFESKRQFTVTVKPTSAPATAANPALSMQSVVSDFEPLRGAVGEADRIEFGEEGDVLVQTFVPPLLPRVMFRNVGQAPFFDRPDDEIPEWVPADFTARLGIGRAKPANIELGIASGD